MSQNVVVNFIGKNNLSKTTAVINNDLKKIHSSVKTVGNGLKSTFGLGSLVSMGGFLTLLQKSAKAAVEDAKSQALLATALKNTIGANSVAIAGAESFIKATQLKTAVLDDQLRPALASAVRATGSLTKGEELLNVALDVSAGTGKDLNTVTIAIAKAYNGNTGALKKLLPSIKQGTDFMAQLKSQFKGSAEIAANNDPYARLTAIFQDMQESIGTALLPDLKKMADYLASPQGQRELAKMVTEIRAFAVAAGQVVEFLVKNARLIGEITVAIMVAKTAWALTTATVQLYTLMVQGAITKTKLLALTMKATGILAVISAIGSFSAAKQDQADNNKSNLQMNAEYYGNNALLKRITGGANGEKALGQRWVTMGQFFTTKIKSTSSKIVTALSDGQKKVQSTAEKFRDSVGLAFGTVGKDENSVFNANMVIDKLKRMVDAAKGFAENLRKLRKAGAGQDVQNELISMGPAQGNIVAKGLLSSGRLSEYLGLRGSLYGTGAGVQSVANNASTASYTINLNKSNVSAQEIINAITAYEKKTGRKYFAR
jgi:hypothetical protein